ncbi:hypothetical protein [uncultured Desulfobacter sp.]|uniref:TOTE conflict system archaeo-eukaryotic primase domain-containing protein n=1 Tax=uncultured Desulfobacter sp. TaxID=240139 RepID=UPI002AA6B524|nr:hypothetical protein [uncultured Desulfobacter sp.]
MTINDYNELKRKYDALLEENKALKAKIREFAPKFENIIFHHKPIQSGETLFSNLEKLVSNSKSDAALPSGIDAGSVTRFSQNHEKIDLFMSLFKGRTDVYAKKWQSKKGASGYSPVCLNQWVPGLCNKPRIKCSACGNQSYGTLNESVVEKHLRGEYVIGVYPMNLDETCHFLAIDFDKEGWKQDIAVIRKICFDFKIPVAILKVV